MKLILTRHGLTIENTIGKIQGHNSGTLHEKGIEQAQKLGRRFKEEKFDIIYSSDLKRAADTAKEIHLHHPTVPIVFTEKLRERDFGLLTGKTKNDLGFENHSPFPREFIESLEVHEKYKVETEEKSLKRAKDIIDEIYEKHKDDTVIIVSHGSFSRFLVAAITGGKYTDKEMLGNTGVSIFDIDEDRNHKIILHNCIKHLEEWYYEAIQLWRNM